MSLSVLQTKIDDDYGSSLETLALLQLKQCGCTPKEGGPCLCILCNAIDELSDLLPARLLQGWKSQLAPNCLTPSCTCFPYC